MSEILDVVVNRRGAARLTGGHVWVYRSDVVSPGLAAGVDEAPAGLAVVRDQGGKVFGTALWSPASQIALRLVSTGVLDIPGWLALLEQRLEDAFAARAGLLDGETDSCRLVFSEADNLPGVIADKYGELVLLQLLSRAVDEDAVREVFLRVVKREWASAGLTVWERPDPRIRELEGLQAPSLAPLYAAGEALAETVFTLNGLKFHYDAGAGQKTGAFLDQRENYAAAARYAHGEALDVCTYQGGFALHLATACRSVTGLDASEAALEVARRNYELNREALGAVEVDWVKGDAFALLREWSDGGAEFDTIVLDPPAFAKSRKAAEGAVRGYKELNLRALKMLRSGGTLVTCSCSHHVSAWEFEEAVRSAAGDAGRRVRLVERRGAAPDHPVLLGVPETEYLKCLILEVLE